MLLLHKINSYFMIQIWFNRLEDHWWGLSGGWNPRNPMGGGWWGSNPTGFLRLHWKAGAKRNRHGAPQWASCEGTPGRMPWLPRWSGTGQSASHRPAPAKVVQAAGMSYRYHEQPSIWPQSVGAIQVPSDDRSKLTNPLGWRAANSPFLKELEDLGRGFSGLPQWKWGAVPWRFTNIRMNSRCACYVHA